MALAERAIADVRSLHAVVNPQPTPPELAFCLDCFCRKKKLESTKRDGIDADFPELRSFGPLSFGSWIGGDRDGNPFVTADSTREALDMARHVIIDHYIAETVRLIGQLSMSTRRIGVSDALAQRTRTYEKQLGERYSRWKQITSAEFYRHFLEFLIARLRFGRRSSKHEHSYKSAQQFEEDLSLIRDSLCSNRLRGEPWLVEQKQEQKLQ